MTGDPHWREAGWRMFEAITKYTKAAYGHSAINDVTATSPPPKILDEMESFWTAETLKYFYLLFAGKDEWSLDEWVFNTEAHPFRRPDAAKPPMPVTKDSARDEEAGQSEEERVKKQLEEP